MYLTHWHMAKRFVLFVLPLSFILCFSSATATTPCRYLTSDFQTSAYGAHFQSQDLYLEWASVTANEVSRRLGQGETFENVLDFVVDQRAALAVKQPGSGPGYGTARTFSGASTGVLVLWPNRESPVNLAWIRTRVEQLIPENSTMEREAESKTWKASALANAYVTRNGRSIKASQLSKLQTIKDRELGKSTYSILHAPTESIREIMLDVHARLRTLEENTNLTEARKFDEFLTAMFGYYNAMPYMRGSSAIGRAFFAGTHLKIFGRKITEFPDYIDVRAMLMTQEEFLATFRNTMNVIN